jgi:phosphoribosyl 1,2-cyclic phosphodiesterase
MEVTFWGVRGSIPSPGPATVRYGGNTSCVSLRLSDGSLVILDCGTGARALGLQLLEGPFGRGEGSATLFLSHTHWDHIQGFPFFGPFYVPGNRFAIYGGAKSSALVRRLLETQMAAQFFPVQSIENLNATLTMYGLSEGEVLSLGPATVRAHGVPHGATSAIAFRIEDAGRAMVYASDAGYGPGGPDDAMLRFCRDADLLIHDSTYTPADCAARPGRGVSSVEEAVACAAGAGVKKLALFHYDQDYSDHDVDELVAEGRRRLAGRHAPHIEIVGAAETLTLSV